SSPECNRLGAKVDTSFCQVGIDLILPLLRARALRRARSRMRSKRSGAKVRTRTAGADVSIMQPSLIDATRRFGLTAGARTISPARSARHGPDLLSDDRRYCW